jgi:hypothetical protein
MKDENGGFSKLVIAQLRQIQQKLNEHTIGGHDKSKETHETDKG